jgi:small subunit ribosomal protein S18
VKKNCPYCKGEAGPDYKEPEKLRAFISERGRILGRLRTGICTKHQRHLTLAIKRARHLAYLPFVAGV